MSDMHPATRPLPPQPSLEYERKAAKALLRTMRESDPSAKLADAQYAIARAYGFASWPKLSHWIGSTRACATCWWATNGDIWPTRGPWQPSFPASSA